MKKIIYIAAAFVLLSIIMGCFATMTPDQRKETYDLRKEAGNSQFVGSANNLDAVGMTKNIWW